MPAYPQGSTMFRFLRRHKRNMERPDRMPFYEADVVMQIAVNDASTMHQAAVMVHVLGAALYRMRDADPQLAGDIGLSAIDVRIWALANLPPRAPLYLRYEGNLDWEYTIITKKNFLSVERVKRPVIEADTPIRRHGHDPQEKTLIMSGSRSRFRRTHLADGSLELIKNIRASALPSESIVETLRRTLMALLPMPGIQKCVEESGRSVAGIEDSLSQAPTQ